MSHDEHAIPTTDQPTTTPSTFRAEYGVALPFASESSQSATRPPLNRSPASATRSNTGTSGGAGRMGQSRRQELSLGERWAVRASDSQFNALAGATGGFVSGIVTCPLDVIKTKLQAQGGFAAAQKHLQGDAGAVQARVYRGLLGTGSIIWREEGIRGMYRGLGPIILGYLPTWAVWFTVYNKSKEYLSKDRVVSDQKTTFVINFWSAIIAGGSSTIVTNPIWVIKTRLMSQTGSHSRSEFSAYPKGASTLTSRPTLSTPWHYRSTFDAARKMYTTEGIRAFYSGLTPALLGLSHVAVQFPAYEYLKTKFTGRAMGAASGQGSDDDGAHWWGILSASILSKILATSATYPHEVIRTRLQTQQQPAAGQEFMQGMGSVGADATSRGGNGVRGPRYKGVIMTFRTILHEEGGRAFYAGLGTNMMRAVPAATVTMLTYEYVMRQLNKARSQGREALAYPDEKTGFS